MSTSATATSGSAVAPTDAYALRARGVVKRYDRHSGPALGGVDLIVSVGSITALIGPNGAGKSTLIKSWIGVERPSEGDVDVAGIDPWVDRGRALALIGYVPQTPAFYRNLRVEDHLTLAATLRFGFDRPLARRHLDALCIPPKAMARQLSGGQQAQLGLALALGSRAPILLLDEPLASLDPLARREFLQLLGEAVRENGTTALLTSHVLTDVAQVCNQLVILGAGLKLLDTSLDHAIAAHRVATGRRVGNAIIATFPGLRGEDVSLLGVGATIEDSQPATLEEVVLGYLAAGRLAERSRGPGLCA